jgi:hypothetical protein
LRSQSTQQTKIEAALRAGAAWWLSSGIQESEGGVARYRHTNPERNARISTEITGYAVSSMLDLHERLGADELLSAARAAGDFLCDRAWDAAAGVMPFEWSRDGALPEHHTYFFDCGIIARGLLRLHRATGEEKYRDVAFGCADSMRRHFPNGRDIDPILALPEKKAIARDARWSRQSDCYQLKSALAWLETGFEDYFEESLARALKTNAAFLDGEPGVRVMDRLHSYSYFLEAALARSERPEVRAALEDGIGRAAQRLRAVRPAFERADVCAQILRVRVLAERIVGIALDEAAAAEEAAWAASYQFGAEAPVGCAGGFCFGHRDGRWTEFVNPVSAAFCLQALAVWDDRNAGRDVIGWRELV